MSPDTQTVKPSVFERHVQTGIQVILVLLLAWAGIKLVTLGENSAVLRERLIYQGEQISQLRRDLREWSDIYLKRTDAERELQILKSDIDSVRSRVVLLEEDQTP